MNTFNVALFREGGYDTEEARELTSIALRLGAREAGAEVVTYPYSLKQLSDLGELAALLKADEIQLIVVDLSDKQTGMWNLLFLAHEKGTPVLRPVVSLESGKFLFYDRLELHLIAMRQV